MERGATIETLQAAVEFVEQTDGPTLVVGQRVAETADEYRLRAAGVRASLGGEQARRLLQSAQVAHASAAVPASATTRRVPGRW